MPHDPETTAAGFLGGDLSPAEREAFSHHLLSCNDCRTEVEQGRQGRRLLESTRSKASGDLRGRVPALVDAEPADALSASRSGRRVARRWLVPAGVPVAAAAAVALILALSSGSAEPPSLRQAGAGFSTGHFPGAQLPTAGAPDLSALDLQPVGAGGGTCNGVEVDSYAYRDASGRRIVLDLSDDAFPEVRCAASALGVLSGAEPLPQPTKVERWVGEGGWFVELLLPRTDAGVAVQAVVLSVVFGLLFRPARRSGLLQLWAGVAVFTAGLFVLRGAH